MANDNDNEASGGLRSLLSEWTQTKATQLRTKRHRLQESLETPQSWAESGGRAGQDDRFTDRKAERSQLEDYHEIRQDGGIIASLLEARALMVFGTGAQYTSEQDAVAEWLNNQFDQLDLLALDIGMDAYFYGYSLGETRETIDGDFGKLELIEPWTTVPRVNNTGEIDEWEQEIKRHRGQSQTQTFDPDDVYHFSVKKASGRDPVGMSMLGRAMSEAHAYRDNQAAIQNAVKLHGFPKWHIKLGRKNGAVIDDNELRRARPKFNNIDELTKWVTGRDVDIETIAPDGFEYEGITEHDLSKLAIAFMLPVEISQIGGGDGLGTGFPARLRERLFLLSAQADQRNLGGQMVGFGKDLIEEYAPPEVEALIADIDEFDLRFEFDDPITDMDDLQSKVSAVGADMTVNERREMFDLPPLDDEDIGEGFESPGTPTPDEGAEGESEPDVDIGLQTGDGDQSMSQDVIEWIRTYGSESGGSLTDDIGGMRDWLSNFADNPTQIRRRFDNAVTLYANQEGVGFTDALEHPIENLLGFYAENRNLSESDTGNPESGDDSSPPEELLAEIQAYRAGFQSIVWADLEHELAGPSFGNDDDVPANVRNRLEEASRFVGWADTEGVPPGNLREFFVRKLEQPNGWSIDSLANGLRKEFGARLGEPDERVNIARTKSAALLNQAKRLAFEDLEQGIEGDLLYYWDGPSDESTTEACSELKELTNPEHGGTPRPEREFNRLMDEVRNEYFPEFTSSGDAIHYQERHALDAMLPSEASVDPAGVGGMATSPTD